MNKATRKQLSEIVDKLRGVEDEDLVLKRGAVEVMALVSDMACELNDIAGEERDKFDNMPEGLQNGDRGQEMQEAADALESAAHALGAINVNTEKPEEGWNTEVADEVSNAIMDIEQFC